MQSFDEWLRSVKPSSKNVQHARSAMLNKRLRRMKLYAGPHIEKMHTNIVAVGSGSADHVTTGFNLAYQWRVNWPGNF